MKIKKYLFPLFLICVYSHGFAQGELAGDAPRPSRVRTLSIEPGVGIHTNFGTDLLISTLVQWNPRKHLSLASHSSYNINNISQRSFNHIETNYNYSINQKFGAGISLYGKRTSHSFMLMVGVKYTSYKETLDNPNFSKVSSSINALSPDYGLMYSLKRGWKKYFFTCRVYLPLYPWPIKGSNILYSDSNMNNIALEFGVGIKLY